MTGQTPQAVLDDLVGTFEDKNADYGNSWEKVGVLKRVMADPEGPQLVELYQDGTYEVVGTPDRFGHADDAESREAVLVSETPERSTTFEENADDVLTRLLDKLCRAYNLIFVADEPKVNESLADAGEDATGYSAMFTSLVRKQ